VGQSAGVLPTASRPKEKKKEKYFDKRRKKKQLCHGSLLASERTGFQHTQREEEMIYRPVKYKNYFFFSEVVKNRN
jgi:hypothetical protein